MMKTVRGVYNGTTFVFEDDIRFEKGQEVIVTLLDSPVTKDNKKREPIDFSRFVGLGEKMFTTDAGEFVREMRDNDRM